MSSGADTKTTLTDGDESLAGLGTADTVTCIPPGGDARPSESPPHVPEIHAHAAAGAAEQTQPGRVIAQRYRLVERLGTGAHGEVWTAQDSVLGERVAVKWMRFARGSMLSRIRREITTLRMLRVPGVVRLLDEGVEDGRPFLVMERIEGRPFPGYASPCPGTPVRYSWDILAAPTLVLLDVLARVHAAGIVHRDLKPDNILVTAAGHPTVLDFGVALWSDSSGERLTVAGQMLGTPHYLAPEQIMGRQVDARADLYAVGVMLYEALTGRLPHEGSDVQAVLRARLTQSVLPLCELAPEVPPVVGLVVDRLLSTRMENRFRSASETLAALQGQQQSPATEPALRWLGHRDAIEQVVEAAEAGRSVDVVGSQGSGRTRCLHEVAQALERQGRRVMWLEPARMPLASLQARLGAPDPHPALRMADVSAWTEARLRAVLAEGTVVFADSAEQLDAWSAPLVDRCRAGPGVLIRALLTAPSGAAPKDVVTLGPLDESALQPLFAGPDRLFHLREDAAHLLWERTEGLPARIEAEVTLWMRLGLARPHDGVLVVDRDTLGRLNASLPAAAAAHAIPSSVEGEPHLEEVLRWLALGGHRLELPVLAEVMGQPAWKLEAAAEVLLSRGAVRRISDQRMVPRGHVDITWLPARRMEAHRAIAAALEPGHEGRLFHLLAAEEAEQAAHEAIETARRHAREGDLGSAVAALGEGLRVVRQQHGGRWADKEVQILAEWVKVAIAEAMPHAMDRALYEITRARREHPELGRLEGLLRANMAAPNAGTLLGIELADRLGPFHDPELEAARYRTRIGTAAARSSRPLLEQAIAQVQSWAEQSGDPLAWLCAAEGRALLRYQEGRFEEAAALHADAAEREPWLTDRITQTLKCTSALLEAFRHREAAAHAEAGRALAARCRNSHWEGRAEWLLRAAKYRLGEAGPPDLELVDAVTRVGAPKLEALVCLNEAAAAFRTGTLETAVALATRAEARWKKLNRQGGWLLARCLALACGAPANDDELSVLSEHASACRIPGIGVQALGLLGQAFPDARATFRHAVPALVEGIARKHWRQRMDVLSVDEALVGATGQRRGGRRRRRRDG